MGLGPRLDLRTTQSLVISPQLQAAIKLLTLSNLELMNEIAAEIDRNPLLEIADDSDSRQDVALDAADSVPQTDTADDASVADQGMDFDLASGQTADEQDVDYIEERFHHDSFADAAGAGIGDDFSFDQFASDDISLAQFLEQQAQSLASNDQPVALYLISLLDEAGYLTEDLAEIADRLGMDFCEVERVLRLIQKFEPTGVGARSLSECIALQAIEADRYDPCMQALISNLELVAKGDLAQLRRLCEVDAEDLADMLRELRSYNPKPGLIYGGGHTVPVIPDVFVRRTGKGWTVELNGATLPRLIVNREYQAHLSTEVGKVQGKKGRPDRQFVDQCVSQAHWLLKALDQRASTIMKVASALVEEQVAFFEKGVSYLKPLTLRQIADKIEMHESTVSRVTSHKYLSCDRGVFELKYFFTTAIQSAGGEDASAEAVRQRLKALVDQEPQLKPLSDDKLVEMLKADGYDIARRTVAKYREAMGIPSSFDRRRRAIVKAA